MWEDRELILGRKPGAVERVSDTPWASADTATAWGAHLQHAKRPAVVSAGAEGERGEQCWVQVHTTAAGSGDGAPGHRGGDGGATCAREEAESSWLCD